MESGKLVLEEADFDLRRELEGLVDMFSVQCDDHSVEIVLELAGESSPLGHENVVHPSLKKLVNQIIYGHDTALCI